MIIKHPDDKSSQLAELERLRALASGDVKQRIEQEIRTFQAGISGERASTYIADFHYGKSPNYGVLHDLRIEMDGRVAQIDHLLVNRTLNVFVLETKHFHSGVNITEDGEFLRWNPYKRRFEGMPSPIAQNERHIEVLRDVFSHIELPKRLGVRLTPTFHSLVLVDPKARIDRPEKFDTGNVIKADLLDKAIEKIFDKFGIVAVFGSLSKLVPEESLKQICQQIASLHKPVSIDYAQRFGIDSGAKSDARGSMPVCRHCTNSKLMIQYGRYGYYFKCLNCDGNTPIKIDCGVPGHKERIRKQGKNFYRECAACGSSRLYFTNPE